MNDLIQRLANLIDSLLLANGITWSVACAAPIVVSAVARVRRRS